MICSRSIKIGGSTRTLPIEYISTAICLDLSAMPSQALGNIPNSLGASFEGFGSRVVIYVKPWKVARLLSMTWAWSKFSEVRMCNSKVEEFSRPIIFITAHETLEGASFPSYLKTRTQMMAKWPSWSGPGKGMYLSSWQMKILEGKINIRNWPSTTCNFVPD